MRNLAKALALIFGLTPGIAAAQVPLNSLPSGTVVGRTLLGPGPAQAIPFSQLISSLLGSNLSIPTINTNSIIFKGSTSGQATLQAQAAAGTPTLSLPTGSGTIPSSAVSPLVLDPVTGILTCPSCVTSVASASPIIPSRATGQTLNLASFAGLTTVGYATAGDGGGATFKNVGTAAFIDSQISGISINAAGAGCTNGTYLGVIFTGGTGTGATATITISGNVATAVTITGNSGNGFTVNDILTPNVQPITGCSTQPTFKVTSVTTPLCSFTDSVGTHFQLIMQDYLDVRQCGAKVNWTVAKGDAGSTDDSAAIQAALSFAGTLIPLVPGNDGLYGTTVRSPAGWSLVNNNLILPQGVKWTGAGMYSTGLKIADALASGSFLTICDSTTHLACFGSVLESMQIQDGAGGATGAMIFSNNIQQAYFLKHIGIFGTTRSCLSMTNGYGGAAIIGIQDLEAGSLATTPCIQISYPSAVIRADNWVIETSGTNNTSGVLINGGYFTLTGFHTEGYVTGINISTVANTGMARLYGLTGGSGCTNLVFRASAAAANVNVMGSASSCTNTLNNNGTLTTTAIVGDVTF